MFRLARFKKTISCLLTFIMFITNVGFSYASETNFWAVMNPTADFLKVNLILINRFLKAVPFPQELLKSLRELSHLIASQA